ncbi:MAG: 2-keto-4-pentenoate hydratase [Asticcacaulis sp.]
MNIDKIASSFVTARREARALEGYPGDVPAHLSTSYAIQEEAIQLWKRPVIGWKIGRLAPAYQPVHQTERLAGPIFDTLFKPSEGEVAVPVFEGGFAAVEAEYVFRVGHDADPEKTEYSEAEAHQLIDALFAGVEMAGSPLATINALGPTVVVSDFGNNFGLILGPELPFDPKSVADMQAETHIDAQSVGKGGLHAMPGGPLAAIGWLAGHLAQRGRPLKKGQLISSGATTGIHDIRSGQASVVTFTGPGHQPVEIRLKAVALTVSAPELAS